MTKAKILSISDDEFVLQIIDDELKLKKQFNMKKPTKLMTCEEDVIEYVRPVVSQVIAENARKNTDHSYFDSLVGSEFEID